MLPATRSAGTVWPVIDADHRFARGAEQDRAAEVRSRARSRISCSDCSGVLPNRPMPGSTTICSRGHAGRTRDRDRPLEEAQHVGQDVEAGIDRLAVVHQDDRRAVPGGHAGDGRVALRAPDVVDDRGAGLQRGLGDLGLPAVDRERRVAARAQAGDHRQDAGEFGPGVERGMAGPGRFAADVDDVGAVGDQRSGHARSRRRGIAAACPPSEKESGVTLTTPISSGAGVEGEPATIGQGQGRGHRRHPTRRRAAYIRPDRDRPTETAARRHGRDAWPPRPATL